jgi:quinolinate synthase
VTFLLIYDGCMPAELAVEIERLKRERNAVVLAHNYQVGEVQDVADYVGDSLGLSQQAAATDADVIVFCGVHFMAETAAILSPSKRVLIPDLDAGCSLASSITGDDLRRWKSEHPGAAVVSYVNTTAEVKAESDYCCTSANAVQVVQSIPEDTEVLFLPDMFLGNHVRKMTGRTNISVWLGECHVHAAISPDDIQSARDSHPGADLMVHPECGCTTPAMYLASAGDPSMVNAHILSTGGMMRHARESTASEFLVATETGILHTLRKQNSEKRFHAVAESMVCRFMKMITLEKLHRSLVDDVYEVTVLPEIAERARLPIERMIAISVPA